METVYFVGNKVLNLVQHYDADKRIVPLNATGHVDEILEDKTLRITWQIDQYPFYTSTDCSPATVTLFS